VRNVAKGEFLYEKGEDSKNFYFVLRGKLELLVKSDTEFKHSKNVDDCEFFGLRTSTTDLRSDYARGAAEKNEILEIDKEQYE
jgi:CRP-like cAMP-binding protein